MEYFFSGIYTRVYRIVFASSDTYAGGEALGAPAGGLHACPCGRLKTRQRRFYAQNVCRSIAPRATDAEVLIKAQVVSVSRVHFTSYRECTSFTLTKRSGFNAE